MLLVHSDRALMAACSALWHVGVLAMSPESETLAVPAGMFVEAVAGTFGRLFVPFDCSAGASLLETVRILQVRCFSLLDRRLLAGCGAAQCEQPAFCSVLAWNEQVSLVGRMLPPAGAH